MFKVVTSDNIHEIMKEMKKKSESYVMNYNDIQRFIKEKNMDDVELVPMDNVCLSEDLHCQLMKDISRDLNDKMLSALNEHKHGEDFCKKVIYKTTNNTDHHAYCFIFGRLEDKNPKRLEDENPKRSNNKHLYVITQKTAPDEVVLNNLFLNNKKLKEFGVPFLWNSLKDEFSCGFTGLTMLQKLTDKNINNIVTNSKYNIVSNSRNWAEEKPSAKTHKNDTSNFYFLNMQTITKDEYNKMSEKDKKMIPNDMMKVSQNIDGLKKYRSDIRSFLRENGYIENKNGIECNLYAQQKIKEFKGLK